MFCHPLQKRSNVVFLAFREDIAAILVSKSIWPDSSLSLMLPACEKWKLDKDAF